MNDPPYPPYKITPNILNLVERIGEVLGELRVQSKKVGSPRLRRNNRIKTVQASLEIEGNTLDLEQITAVLAGKRVLAHPREIQEVRNAFTAYEQMGKWSPYCRADLIAAHEVLMTGLIDEAGRIRRGSSGIQRGDEIVHIAPPAARVPQLMDNLLDWLEKIDEHPLVVSSVFHYEFEFIHPFQDGNGRLGRLWQTLILSRWRSIFSLLPVESVIRDRQSAYYAALRRSDDGGESTVFIEFMLGAILQAIEEACNLSDQVVDQVSDQVKSVLCALRNSPRSALEVMNDLGLSHRPTFRKNYLRPALKDGWIEMTNANSPRSPNQKYRITQRGAHLVADTMSNNDP